MEQSLARPRVSSFWSRLRRGGRPTDELPAGEYEVLVKAGSKDLVAPRVKVTPGRQAMVKIVLKRGQLVPE